MIIFIIVFAAAVLSHMYSFVQHVTAFTTRLKITSSIHRFNLILINIDILQHPAKEEKVLILTTNFKHNTISWIINENIS